MDRSVKLVKTNANKFSFHYHDTNEEEIKSLFGLLFFGGLYHNTENSQQKRYMIPFLQGKFTELQCL